MKTIVSNAGGEGSVVVEKLLMQDSPTYGFDAATGEYKDMVRVNTVRRCAVRVEKPLDL